MIEYMFYIPLFHYHIEDWSNVKPRLVEAIKVMPQSNPDRPTGQPAPKEILKIIKQPIDNFLSDIESKFEDVEFNMWWQCYQKNEGHRPHAHGEAHFGSTLFLDFVSEEHPPTRFYAPFNNYLTGNVLEYEKDIKEGDIIFFPGNVIHESPINKSLIPKKIIAMNLNVPKLVNKLRGEGL